MSACEWCWQEARKRAFLLGTLDTRSVTEHYIKILNEQDSQCPERRKYSQLKGEE
jgi:hypothetical protein